MTKNNGFPAAFFCPQLLINRLGKPLVHRLDHCPLIYTEKLSSDEC